MMNKHRIAKLVYQSKHRGCKENDILLSKFADKIFSLSSSELDLYEYFLNESDSDIYQWICNALNAPDKYKKIIEKIKQY